MTLVLYGADVKNDVLYGLFAGWNCINGTLEGFASRYKSWTLHFYTSEKGRALGMQYQKREYVDCDFLTFELRLVDLFEVAKLRPVIIKDRSRVVGDVLKFIKEK